MRIRECPLRVFECADRKKLQALSFDQLGEIGIRDHGCAMPARLQSQSESYDGVHIARATQGG